ncbi:transposase [Microcystis aeruginosa CS-564/01]|uniref:transposase n=1 Tax=Microcystis aeruginosa TaxID=1126 RepID=UPI00232AC40A|nr:transposase [Microcystis aeruginosa]MDB9424197.1 transposase [Microcystis aeruginosa CS-564/01]
MKATKGFCFYKYTNGIKRHLATDSLGFPFFAHCTHANLSDDQGLIELLTRGIDYFKLKPSELPKTTILLDNGYHPDKIEKELVKVYPEIMTKIQFELSPKPLKTEKAEKG